VQARLNPGTCPENPRNDDRCAACWTVRKLRRWAMQTHWRGRTWWWPCHRYADLRRFNVPWSWSAGVRS